MALRDVAYDTLERGEHAHSNGHHHHHTLDERPRKPVVHSLSGGATDYDAEKRKTTRILSPQAVGRAIAGRAYRVLRRGNLPFLIVFMVALFVFFGALAGIGYVDPETQAINKAAAAEAEFIVGGPVFDRQESQKQLERQIAERRALEEQWVRKKRPNAGNWMQSQRDDRAVRKGRRLDSEQD
ncbi:uncharacterized protein LOC62_02G002319 [Vanrija pseudolonga]|uniref:Uncharacterized protein n=1 Tax=Vanrija pseudolonga TaxID=143232 RepID=A0AAF0Y6W5_9TREE|nr:hypothetical protein LOC62_02G002319 [Vanrija pseudolonga]